MILLSWARYVICFSGFISLTLFGISCTNDHTRSSTDVKVEFEAPSYARGFETFESRDYTLIKVTRPWAGAPVEFIYALTPKPQDLPAELPYDHIIQIPVRRLVVTSTTHIPALDLLGCQELLVGFPQTNFISSPEIRKQIDQGKVTELGTVGNLDYETLVTLKPDVVMTYQSGPDNRELERLELTGLPVMLNADFLEESPLGKAEWIKVMGWLVGKPDSADSIFAHIETSYKNSRSLVREVTHRPTVLSGSLYNGTWFAPGGDSFVAQFVQDAGGLYCWADHPQSGNLELSFEAVMSANNNTDKWIGTGGFTSIEQLISSDQRYNELLAVSTGEVYNYHRRIGATGGYEYLEMGTARPDIVLRDFIKMLHPELLPTYDLYFFKKLDS